MICREVDYVVDTKELEEGVGVRVRRGVGTKEFRNFDPFLLLDEVFAAPGAGFPDHPHRGLESMSFLFNGYIQHEDFAGNKGIVNPGDIQWVTTGRGLVHSELPFADGNHGVHIWVSLPKSMKMVEPSAQEIKAKDVPVVTKDGVTVKVLVGEAMETKSAVKPGTPIMILDFTVEPGKEYTHMIPCCWNALIFIFEGEGVFGFCKQKTFNAKHTLVLTKGDRIWFANKSEQTLHFLLLAGKPLNEAIVQHGPFAMNSREEIEKTVIDYHSFKNGFEKAKNWMSTGGQKFRADAQKRIEQNKRSKTK